MNDKELDQLLRRAATEWRLPVDPPLDEIWSSVAQEAFAAPRAARAPGWWGVGIAAAVALIIGVAGGRYSTHQLPATPSHRTAPIATLPASPAANDGNHHAVGDLLGRTAVLLAALPADSASHPVDSAVTRESARLLTTTRLLLDSPSGADPQLRNLLQDLELVLAQVARLEPAHHKVEMQFIQTALDEHDLVPRLRSAAADLSSDEF